MKKAIFIILAVFMLAGCRHKHSYGEDDLKMQNSVRVLTIDGDTATIYIRVGIKIKTK